MTDDATQTDESQTSEGTEGSPEANGTDAAAQIASARKRQAGAEAARQAAEAKAADALKRLADYETANRSAEDNATADVATLREQLRVAEENSAKADARVEAARLDAKYPNARKELPEVADEVRLAKFEAMLAEDEPPTPRVNNGTRPSTTSQKEETSADIKARLLSLKDVPWA